MGVGFVRRNRLCGPIYYMGLYLYGDIYSSITGAL